MRRIVRELDPDLVHAHQAVGFGLWGAISGHHPFVVSAWGSDVLVRPQESLSQALVLRYVLRKADFCIPVARHLEARMRKYGLALQRSETIPMGVDLTRFPAPSCDVRHRPLGFISTRSFEPIYDVATLVRAAKRIFNEEGLEGRILGGGSLRDELVELASREGVLGRLRFEGPTDHDRLMESLAKARIYISTSRSDGASVSLLEAMSRGCFPIVTDIAANREWIVPGENGVLFPVGDAATLATRVLENMKDESRLEKACEINLRIVRERGDLNANLARVEAVYRRLLSE